MTRLFARIGRIRLKIRSLLVVVALVGLGLGIWREYWRPEWVFRRAIHQSVDVDLAYRRVGDPTGVWQSLRQNGTIQGLDHAATIAEVDRAIHDWHPALRIQALNSIQSLKLSYPRSLARIHEFRDDPHPQVRATVAELFIGSWMKDRSARLATLQFLEDPDPLVRAETARFLAVLSWGSAWKRNRKIGIPDLELLELALQRCLLDRELDVRGEAAFRLAEMGHETEALPALVDYVRNRPDRMSEVLNGCNPKANFLKIAHRSNDALAFLVEDMGVEHPGYSLLLPSLVKRVALQGGEPALSQLEQLAIRALDSPEPRIRRNSAVLLHELDSDLDLLPLLIEAMQQGSRALKLAAIQALGQRGQGHPEVVLALKSSLADPNPEVITAVGQALRRIETAQPSALGPMTR